MLFDLSLVMYSLAILLWCGLQYLIISSVLSFQPYRLPSTRLASPLVI